MTFDHETAAAFEHRTKARLTELRIANTPATGAADSLREHGAWLEQRDDFRERVGHVRTLAKEIWTIHGRWSTARRLRWHHERRGPRGEGVDHEGNVRLFRNDEGASWTRRRAASSGRRDAM